MVKVPLLVSASSVVVVHNHPSGVPTPSRDDLNMADKVEKALDCIGCPMLDFVIVAEDGYWSRLQDGVGAW